MTISAQSSLTPRQAECLEHIVAFMAQFKTAPTYVELADRMGITKPGVFDTLRSLERKGRIRMEKYRARSIQLVGCKCPCCGRELE